MEKYNETMDVISSMAKVKMTMNSHKGNIEDCSPELIMNMLYGEVEELSDAIDKDGDILHIIEESADVMNFLIAVTHQQIEKYRKRKDKPKKEGELIRK